MVKVVVEKVEVEVEGIGEDLPILYRAPKVPSKVTPIIIITMQLVRGHQLLVLKKPLLPPGEDPKREEGKKEEGPEKNFRFFL